MGEISKTVGQIIGQWVVDNLGWTVIILLFILSGIFKLTKREIDPLGAVVGWIGKAFTKEVRKDIAALKTDTDKKFDEIKADRAAKIQELRDDYNKQISELRSDLDGFETTAKAKMIEIKEGTNYNCESLTSRLDAVERSNDMQTMRQIKAHVLDFANTCMNGVKHTIQDFRNIIKENEEYEELVRKYNLTNDVYTADYKYIMEEFDRCRRTRSFLNYNGEPYDEEVK